MGSQEFKTTTRDLTTIPEKVTHTMLFFGDVARSLMVMKMFHGQHFGGVPNCHILARIYAEIFPKILRLADGMVVTIERGQVTHRCHSWLVFREIPKFGIDLAPIGAVPFLTFPNLLFFDHHTLLHECPIPEGAFATAPDEYDKYVNILKGVIENSLIPPPQEI